VTRRKNWKKEKAKICNEPCSDRRSGHTYSRCLSILQDNHQRQASVVKYMVNFIKKPEQERHSIISEWLRYTTTTTNSNPCCFFIPFVGYDDEDEDDDEEKQTDDYDGHDNKPPLHALK
jgi:thymidylate synthase